MIERVSVPRVSVIVPILNEGAALPALFCALEGWRADIQLIVVDGGSTDNSLEIATGRADITLSSPAGRARQLNAGASAASGEFLVFLHCDTRIEGRVDSLMRALDGMPQWGFCKTRLSGANPALRVIERFMNWRAKLTHIATGDQLLCFRRACFENAGGFAAIPLMEDVEICKRVRRIARPTLLPVTVTTSSRRWEHHGIARTVLLMWSLRLAYWWGTDPQLLHRRYYR